MPVSWRRRPTSCCRDGYLDTTVAAIAAEAGVAVQTLYLGFGSKVAILEAVHDVAVAGDTEPLAVLERPWVAQFQSVPDAASALAILLEHALGIIERVGPVTGIIQAASADTEVRELLDRVRSQRHATLRALAGDLVAKAGLTPGLGPDTAADILYALVSEELHHLLVVERGWRPEAWRDWVGRSATTWLLEP